MRTLCFLPPPPPFPGPQNRSAAEAVLAGHTGSDCSSCCRVKRSHVLCETSGNALVAAFFSFFLEVAPVRCSLCAAEVLTGGFLTSHGPEFLAAAQRLQLLLRLLFSAPLPPLLSSAAGKVIFLSRVAVTRWPRHLKAPDSFSLRQSVILAFKPLSVTSWF